MSLFSRFLNHKELSVVNSRRAIKDIGIAEKITIFKDKENISFEAKLVT